jgi:hypothetical protein
MVKLTDSNGQSIGDVVRGGNVLGEEAFFAKKSLYRESSCVESLDAAVLQVDADNLRKLCLSKF